MSVFGYFLFWPEGLSNSSREYQQLSSWNRTYITKKLN